MNGPVRIPQKKIGVLIGPAGSTKRAIEKLLGVKISVEEDGLVTVEGDDGLAVYKGELMVKGIARGLRLEDVKCLSDDNNAIIIIDLKEMFGDREAQIIRMKSRVIGTGGKAKRMIESFTGAKIAVSGKTISIIGRADKSEMAREAVDMLLEGRMHSTVFKILERKANEKREEERKEKEKESEGAAESKDKGEGAW